jgi:hypothetical protein
MAIRDLVMAAMVGVASGVYVWSPYTKDMKAIG